MSRTAVTLAACGVLLLAVGALNQAQAQSVVVEEETLLSLHPAGQTDIYNGGLAVLSNGSFVYFEDASPQGPTRPIADSCLLYDEDINPPTGALSVIASVTDMASLIGEAVVTSSHNFQCRDMAVDADDNVYLLLDNYAGDNELYVVRLPNTGGNSFGAPELVADATQFGIPGSQYTPACRLDVDTALDTLIISIDDQDAAHDVQASLVIDEDALLALYGGGQTDIRNTGLGVLSNGALVYFEDTATDAGVEVEESCVLYDASVNPPTGALSIIASVTEIATLMGQAVTVGHQCQIRDLAVGSNDNVYLLLEDYVDPDDAMWLLRIPNTGGSSFGAPEVVADATRLGARNTPSCRVEVDANGPEDILILCLSNVAASDDVSGATVNGVFSLIASATNNLDPTLIATMGQVAAGSGGTPGTDKGTVSSMAVLPSGDIAIVDGRAESANRGNLLLMDRSTGNCTLWATAASIPGTPTMGELSYNATTGNLGVCWAVGTDSSGPGDDRVEERSIVDGSVVRTLILEDDLVAVNPDTSPTGDLRCGEMYDAGFANDGTYYYVMDYNSEESIYRVLSTPCNGVYTLPADATNTTNPTLISTMGQITVASGGTPRVDKGTASGFAVLPSGDIVVHDGRNESAHRGNIVLMDRSTGACALWVVSASLAGTPDQAEIVYNSVSGNLGVFWTEGTDATGPGDDRLEERSIVDGSLIKTVIWEDDFDTLNPDNTAGHDFRLGQLRDSGLATDGTNYYILDYNAEEALYRIPQSLTPVEDWLEY